MTTETEELLWILSQEKKLIPHSLIKFAMDHNKSLIEIMHLDKSYFIGVDEKSIDNFLKNRESLSDDSIIYAQKIFDLMQRNCIDLLTYNDQLFPPGLKQIENKSIHDLLYKKGQVMRYENCIAVVGTRNCSTHAVEFTREISRSLAKDGFVIVAGLARGIDAAAHRGAISVGGKTVAVLPWMYEPYPPEHEYLLNEIQNNGSVISENFFQSQQRMDKYKFLQRNAVISGISEVLIAVESSFSGGTRWQVELALSQGKKVIAVEPEKSNTQSYKSYKQFIQKGAHQASTPSEAIKLVNDMVDFKEQIEKPMDEEIKINLLLQN